MVTTMSSGPPNKSLAMQNALPLGVGIDARAKITIDNSASLNVPISRCTRQGGLLESIATDGLVAALRSGNVVTVTAGSPTSSDFEIPMSLTGLGAALDSVVPIRPVADTRETSVDEAPDLEPVGNPAPAKALADDEIDDALQPVT
jgi:invasion protein IalB